MKLLLVALATLVALLYSWADAVVIERHDDELARHEGRLKRLESGASEAR